jgi:pyruvate/2-oxoglutarate dehydrogenase complex dihydrolipoamide acyltransferase (E2) component
MAQVQAVWNKLNAHERLVAIGAGLVILGFILSVIEYSASGGTIALLGAIAVLVVYFLKYSPNQKVNWPAPIPTIVLGISAVVAGLAALDVLRWLSTILNNLTDLWAIAAIIVLVGGLLMLWQSWLEYQATQPATAAPAAPATEPAAAAAAAAPAPAPAPAPTVDSDQAPPA